MYEMPLKVWKVGFELTLSMNSCQYLKKCLFRIEFDSDKK
jgi:hypothetical protein